MHLFYLTEVSGEFAQLDEEETRHCLRVLRMKVGDTLEGIDGSGMAYTCVIVSVSKKEVSLHIRDRRENPGEHPFQIRLAISPLHKQDRFEWLVEKSVELGVTRITPLLTNRTVKTGLRADRLERIAISALKQCKRSRLPRIDLPTPWSVYLASLPQPQPDQSPLRSDGSIGLLGWCESKTPIQNYEESIKKAISVDMVIGPEGDLTEDEVNQSLTLGFCPVSLGENRLRTETAGIHLLSVIKYLKQF